MSRKGGNKSKNLKKNFAEKKLSFPVIYYVIIGYNNNKQYII